MSESEQETTVENPQRMREVEAGVGLEDAFKLLSLTHRERLLSLTFKLGHSPAEELVHAMSLFGLGKGDEALSKLWALGENRVARCLTEMLERQGSRPEAIWRGEGIHLEPGVEDTIELARIFRVLAEEKLCDESWRDKAYQVALSACSRQTGNGAGRRTLEKLVQEAREVCGATFYQGGDTLSPITGLCSYSSPGDMESGGRSAAVRIQKHPTSEPSRTEDISSPPSSLRTTPSSWGSYPSHLEVSMSPTVQFDVHEAIRDVQDLRSPSPQVGLSKEVQETTLICGPPGRPGGHVSTGLSPAREETLVDRAQHCPLGEKLSASASLPVVSRGCPPQQRPLSLQLGSARMNHVTRRPENSGSQQILTPESTETKAAPQQDSHLEQPGKTAEPSASASASLGEGRESDSPGKHLKPEDDDEEEEEFFSFVILHSQEDGELAGRLKEQLESLDVGPGATFSQDFAIPGKDRLSCVDTAINNSAFVILLLSRKFDRRMLEFESNCALTSSLEKCHKSNTVIPLFPSENRLPREDIPASLRILVSLEEGARGFEKKVKKAMAQKRIEQQKRVWRQERILQAQKERERRLRQDNEMAADLLHGSQRIREQLQVKHVLSGHQKVLECYQPMFNAQPGQVPAPGMHPFLPGPGGYYYPPYMPTSPIYHHLMHPEGYPSLGGPFSPSNIHIENASCIVIGNDSQMTVGTGGENSMRENGPSNQQEE